MICRSLFVLLYLFLWPLCFQTLGSIASLLAQTLYQGNPDMYHRLWNILSTERYILHMQVLLECCLTNEEGYVPLVVTTSLSFPHSWLITGFAIRLTRRVSLVEQEQFLVRFDPLSRKSWYVPQALKYRINWEIYTPYAGAAGMLLHINGKLTMGKLKSSLLSKILNNKPVYRYGISVSQMKRDMFHLS
jgi:hypothetical protein